MKFITFNDLKNKLPSIRVGQKITWAIPPEQEMTVIEVSQNHLVAEDGEKQKTTFKFNN